MKVGAFHQMEQPFEKTEAGIYNNFICWSNLGGLSQEVVWGSIRLFADEMMPALREGVAPAVSVAS